MSRVLKQLFKQEEEEGQFSPDPQDQVQDLAQDSIQSSKVELVKPDLRLVPPVSTEPEASPEDNPGLSADVRPEVKIAQPPPFRLPQKKLRPIQWVMLSCCVGILFLLGVKLTRSHFWKHFFAPPLVVEPPSNSALKIMADFQLSHNGILLYQAQKYTDAKEVFEKLAKEYPLSAVILNNLGMSYFKLKEYALAEKYFTQVLEKNPADAIALNNLGSLAMHDSAFDRAISDFQKALITNPDLVEARLNLAKAYEKVGKPGAAVKEYEAYLKAPTGDPVIKRMLGKRIIQLNSLARYFEDTDEDEEVPDFGED